MERVTNQQVTWCGVFLLLWLDLVHSECANPGISNTISLNITCDKDLEIYADGKFIGSRHEYNETSTFVLPINTHAIAVKCTCAAECNGGIIGSFSNGLVTNTSWKCSEVYSPTWNKAEFNSNYWSAASTHGSNGDLPWKMLPSIIGDAKWIWTDQNTEHSPVFCRYEFQKCDIHPEITKQSQIYLTDINNKDHALKSHVIADVDVYDVIECGLKCLSLSGSCKSFNYEYNGAGDTKKCELNSSTKENSMKNYTKRNNYLYYEVATVLLTA